MIGARRLGILVAALCLVVANAQESPRVYRDRVTPHWFANNTKFWYENTLPGGGKEIIVVDAEKGAREKVERAPADDNKREGLPPELELRSSARDGGETRIAFENRLTKPVDLFWIDPTGTRQSYGTIPGGGKRDLGTFAGHVWALTDASGETIGLFAAAETPGVAIIDETLPKPKPENRRSRNRAASERAPVAEASPDGNWQVVLKDHNIFLKAKGDDKEVALSEDGKDGAGYTRYSWSPDSKTLAAFRFTPGERKEVHLVTSSPPEGGRATLRSRPYVLPGDKFPRYEVNIFDLASRKQIKPEVDPFEHEWEQPRVRWSKVGSHFAYAQDDRGHQRYRVIEVNARDGSIRNLVDEKTQTFIWTTHTEGLNLQLVNWFEKSDAFIYVSEQSGWRHLYLVGADGKMAPITQGEWVIRGLEKIDEAERQVWFRASGVFAGQDPYFIHYGRVNFDGSGLVFFTAGDGTHTLQYSPDRKWIIDTFSRVDMASANELRRVSDGKLVCKLEEADTQELKASGWLAPEVFVAKGRDGKTDIWGIICRPRDFDPKKKYPILEDIYAGPQAAFVPKAFNAQDRYAAFNKSGFIVVKIDGMGTAYRSKAFHDVSWHNLKDGGFTDRILWMKAAAKKYPELDIDRVGVYGTSAGGQNAAGAVLFHPEFYKAAIANCGCHDNRMDKASWNEQWMGYPVGPHYAASSNIDNAGKLQGALFLIVGELDTNVPPESTYRFADALIKARKDFEYLVVPGADHGTRGPASAYVQRRMQDFFAYHLQGERPPNRNATNSGQ